MRIKIKDKKYQASIRLTVLGVFIFANVLIACVAIGLQYYFSKELATESAHSSFDATASQTASYIERIDEQAILSTKTLASFPHIIDDDVIGDQTQLLFAQTMQSSPSFYSAIIGFENGDLYQLINLDSSVEVRRTLNAVPGDRWCVAVVSGEIGQRVRQLSYYNNDFELRTVVTESSDYFATSRPWYIDAKHNEIHKTSPYLFKSLKAPGQTYSTVIAGTKHVLAVDIALSSLSVYLQQQHIAGDGEIYLYQQSGEIIASNQTNPLAQILANVDPIELTQTQHDFVASSPSIRTSNLMDWPPIDFAVAGEPQGYAVDVMSIVSATTGLSFEYINGQTWPQFLELYRNDKLDMVTSVSSRAVENSFGHISDPFVDLPFAVITKEGQNEVSHISQLNGKRLAISAGWSVIPTLKRNFPQIELIEYPLLRDVFVAVQAGEVYAGIDSRLVLTHTAKQFFMDGIQFHPPLEFSPLALPTSLHVMSKDQTLVEIVDLAIGSITPKLRAQLDSKWGVSNEETFINKSQGVVPYKLLIDLVNQPQTHNKISRFMIGNKENFVYIKPLRNGDMFTVVVPIERVLGKSLQEIKWSMVVTGICLLLMLLMSWFFVSPIVTPISKLSQQNKLIKQRKYGEVTLIESGIIELEELSQSIIDMSASIHKHEKEQAELLDAFIKIISQAIDDKSHYTAGHCARVPEIAMGLAQAASASNLAPFKDFSFKNDSELREFDIASWLHDCGKITTPVHIVDKGTKLEIIHNRIHEIRTRFEVLWRDAEIRYLKQVIESPDTQPDSAIELIEAQQQLTEDFAFIAQANVGGEFMDKAHIDKLKSLSAQTWLRNFDNRLGLSPVEENALPKGYMELPALETLLSDKPEHITKREDSMAFDPKFEIKMDVPENESNRGELYNLSIGRGTLTAEDRFIINEHIISTIKMLEALPLPPELSRVPRYASTHHETLKGTGYPRKLSAEQLSVPERVMVVADIFEALTADDRPYKKAKPVSVAIDILHKMALDRHVDIDIFELLLTSGIYLEYANKYLDKKQIDSVDIEKYLREPVKPMAAEECRTRDVQRAAAYEKG